MLTYLVDPREKEIRPWPDDQNRPVQVYENPVTRLEIACKRLRELLTKLGVDLNCVPVTHRTRHIGKVHFWNLALGRQGSGILCQMLTDNEDFSHECGWRLATVEEVKNHLENAAKSRKEYARRKLRYDAQAVKQVSAQHTLQMLVDAAEIPGEDLENLSPEELEKLQSKLDEAKAKGKPARKRE